MNISVKIKIFFFIILIEASPYLKIKKATKKNLHPLDTIDKNKNINTLIPKIPDAKLVILYGKGENPPIRTSRIPNSL